MEGHHDSSYVFLQLQGFVIYKQTSSSIRVIASSTLPLAWNLDRILKKGSMADGLLNVKGSFGHYEEKSVEHIPSHDESCRGNGGETKLSPEAEAELAATDRKILFKMDILIIPIITMLYLLVFIDRANIGNARVAGLSKDLELTDLQYKTGEQPEVFRETPDLENESN